MRLFISYGHDENIAVAERIRNDLRARGHSVWFDEERLKPGHDWEEFIEKGLEHLSAARADSAVVLLLTPHAVRRRFCQPLIQLFKNPPPTDKVLQMAKYVAIEFQWLQDS